MIERRRSRFTEKLSLFMVVVAAIGALGVLMDPRVVILIPGGHTLTLGGADGFSADLKGAVISAILIGGWTAVKEYWLGASASGTRQSETVSRIAEASPATAAAAVAAAVAQPNPLQATDVKVEAAGDVTVEGKT